MIAAADESREFELRCHVAMLEERLRVQQEQTRLLKALLARDFPDVPTERALMAAVNVAVDHCARLQGLLDRVR